MIKRYDCLKWDKIPPLSILAKNNEIYYFYGVQCHFSKAYNETITEISTFTFFGNVFTATVARAG